MRAMARETKESKELWAKFAIAAINGYSIPEEIDDFDDLIDDMADVATGVADTMLDEYEERFGGGRGERRRVRRKRDDDDPDPEPDSRR